MLSRETKVGILAMITIAFSIWGYKFIKGQNILTTSQVFYIDFENVRGLQASTPVLLKGYQVGSVINIYPHETDAKYITVEIEVENHINVPKNTEVILTPEMMGDVGVTLDIREICKGETCAPNGTKLKGKSVSILGGMMDEGELKEKMSVIETEMSTIVDQLNKMVNDPSEENVIARSLANLDGTLKNMQYLTTNLNRKVGSDGQVTSILSNLDNVSGSIQPDKIQQILDNANSFSSDLSKMDLQQISGSVDSTLLSAQDAVAKLTLTMQKADIAISNLNKILEGINNGEGSLGKIAKDDKLYEEIKEATANTNALVDDFKKRPYRYIPFKRKKKVEKYDKADAKKRALSSPGTTEELSNH